MHMCLDYAGLYYVLLQIHSPVYIPAKPVKHQMLLFFCSLGSVTGNQPTTMLMGVQAVEKGMLLLKILPSVVFRCFGFFC